MEGVKLKNSSPFEVEFLDHQALKKADRNEFRIRLKTVFDGSIPWDQPSYDDAFQDFYFEHASACITVFYGEEPVALSLAFTEETEDEHILYIAGIWVSDNYKSQGLGRLIIDSLIECAFPSCFGEEKKSQYITLRTQNPQVYEYFNKHYFLYPAKDKPVTETVSRIASWVNEAYSPTKTYEEDKLIIREVFPKGIIVGHLHPAKSDEINSFINDNLNVLEGDSYVLVMENKKLSGG